MSSQGSLYKRGAGGSDGDVRTESEMGCPAVHLEHGGRGHEPRIQASLEAGRAGNRFSPEGSRRNQPRRHLDFRAIRLTSDF